MTTLVATKFVLSFPTGYLGWDLGLNCVSSLEISDLLSYFGFIIESDARPTGVPFKRAATLLAMIRTTTPRITLFS